MHDYIIIGSGIAGLNFALQAARLGTVLIITKKKAAESSTNRAQGGIAAVINKADDFKNHVSDTMIAGSQHNNKKMVEEMVREGPNAIRQLIEYGVHFTQHRGKLALTQEGGHGQKRIAFVGDYTGQEIEKKLLNNVKHNPNIQLLEHCFALKLLVKNKICQGVQVIHKNHIKNIYGASTIIATGGIGQLYEHTTNPRISTGDGYAMAKEAGCKFKDMEFIQFHPTAFDHKRNPNFLISEALRGEEAVLRNSLGEAFMNKYDKRKDLSPRDIVTRAIAKEQSKGPVFLDIRHIKESTLKTRFPQIFSTLQKYGYNLAKDLIPITPVAHYSCGGIKIDDKGRTNIKRLFAFGEVAYTGVHGANRLASNSLLEALVFSSKIISQNKKIKKIKKDTFITPKLTTNISFAKKAKHKIKKIMWNKVGIVRNQKGLNEASKELTKILKELNNIKGINKELAEAKNMCITGLLITDAARKRPKSLGCHFVEN